MTRPFFFDAPLLPDGFELPVEYKRLPSQEPYPDITPWSFLSEDMALSLSYYGAMLKKFPGKPLIPFAIINDQSGLYNDGFVVLACFDGNDTSGNPSVRIFNYSTPKKSPWDNLASRNFSEWLLLAKQESIRFNALRDS